MAKTTRLSILHHLRKDARMSFAKIARTQGLATSTVFDHVARLENTLINRYVALCDFQTLGYPFRVVVFVPNSTDALNSFVQSHPSLNSLYTLKNGGISAEFIFSSLQQEEDLKEALSQHTSNWSLHRVIEPIEQELFLP